MVPASLACVCVALAAVGCAGRRPTVTCPVKPAATSETTGALEVHVTRGGSEPEVYASVNLDGHVAQTDACGVAVFTAVAPGEHSMFVETGDAITPRSPVDVWAGKVATVRRDIPRPPTRIPEPRTDDRSVLVGGLALVPRSDVPRAYGVAVEAAVLPLTSIEECIEDARCAPRVGPYLSVTGLAAIAGGEPDGARRGLYGLRLAAGLGWGPRLWFVPFATLGLDALRVTTTLPSGAEHAGVTLGADARIGVLGQLGEHLLYQVGASYLGAIAPGTGDNAGGLVLQLSLGWRFRRGRDD